MAQLTNLTAAALAFAKVTYSVPDSFEQFCISS
jgi:hypothetical protein